MMHASEKTCILMFARADYGNKALLYDASGVGAEGGEQGGEDGDDNLTDALQGVLRTVFHKK